MPDGRSAKPLNIMQFMREQAASTRVASHRPRQASPSHGRAIAKRPQKRRGLRTGRSPRGQSPPDAGRSRHILSRRSSRTPQAMWQVACQRQSLSTAPPLRLRLKRRARPSPAGPERATGRCGGVQRHRSQGGQHRLPCRANAARRSTSSRRRSSEQASVSWLQWIWSALGSTFTALATAVHQLVGAVMASSATGAASSRNGW